MSGFPATDTLGTMVDEVVDALQGHTLEGERITTLLADMSNNDTAISVADSILARGTIEIGQELMWVASTTGDAGIIQPWGRGWKSTTAESHLAGDPVYINPSWPKAVVAREIRNTVLAMYPMLFAIKEHSFTTTTVDYQFDLPADCEQVLKIQWLRTGLEGWIPVESWDLMSIVGTTELPNGKVLSILDLVPVGSQVKVTYAAIPTPMTSLSDTWTSTGLPSSCKDVAIYGTLARMARSLDLARLSTQSAQAAALGQQRPQGIAIQVAREYQSNYTTRLAEERRLLLNRINPRAHRTR